MKFFFLILSLITLGAFYFWPQSSKNKKYNKVIKVGVNLITLNLPLDPISNPSLANAFFSNNLYSNLIEVDENNKYKLSLASSYYFLPNQLVFEFKNSRVNAYDAEFSIKRIIYQKKQLHSNFSSIICNSEESETDCENRVLVDQGKLIIRFYNQNKVANIIPALASIDYKIVPIGAFSTSDYKTAVVNNYKITSGFYSLEIINSSIGNKYYFNLKETTSKNLYKKFELFDISNAGSSELEKNWVLDNMDIIGTNVNLNEKTEMLMNSKGWNMFETHSFKLSLFVFSKNAIEKTTATERFAIANRIKTFYQKLPKQIRSKEAYQFLSDFGQGYLNESQKSEILEKRLDISSHSKNKVIFAVNNPNLFVDFQKNNPDIVIQKLSKFPLNLTESERPDLFEITNDLSFDLNFSQISFAANVGLLDISKEQLKQFAEITDEGEKIKFINEAHFRTLKNCQIYPLSASPYFTSFRGDFTHELSKFNSRTLLYKIH